MMHFANTYAGLPLYRVAPVIKRHVARRRGQAHRLRSKRTWIDRISEALLQPNDVIIVKGDRILAGAVAYDALLRRLAEQDAARTEAKPRLWGTGLPDKLLRLQQAKLAIEEGKIHFPRTLDIDAHQRGMTALMQRYYDLWSRSRGIPTHRWQT